MLYHVLPCFTMSYHVLPCFTMLTLDFSYWRNKTLTFSCPPTSPRSTVVDSWPYAFLRSWVGTDQLHLLWQNWDINSECHGIETPCPQRCSMALEIRSWSPKHSPICSKGRHRLKQKMKFIRKSRHHWYWMILAYIGICWVCFNVCWLLFALSASWGVAILGKAQHISECFSKRLEWRSRSQALTFLWQIHYRDLRF